MDDGMKRHREGLTQEAIGAELDVDDSTVSRVLASLQKRSPAKTQKREKRMAPPSAALPEDVG
jgi:DNA-binding MarR family transcriptional regulator